MLNGLDGSRRCWSQSVLTVVDPEQAPTGSQSELTTLEDGPIRPHKDFGVFLVPPRLRCDPSRQKDLDGWTQLGLGLGCTLGEHAVVDMVRWQLLTKGSGGQPLLLSTPFEYVVSCLGVFVAQPLPFQSR